jgi:hypothetical protein
MAEKHMLALAEKLKTLKDTKAAIEEELKFVTGEVEKTTCELSDLMAEKEVPSFTHSGFSYSLTTRTYASALGEEAGGRDILYAALRKNGFEHLFTVNAQTLSGFVKEQAAAYAEEHGGREGLPAWLAGKVKLFDKVAVMVRKANKK